MHGVLGLLILTAIGAENPPASQPAPGASNGPGHAAIAALDPADECWQLTLPDTFRIALDNSEIIRIVSCRGAVLACTFDGPTAAECCGGGSPGMSHYTVAPLSWDADLWRFKSEVMAHIRSAEQCYWDLAHEHARIRACDQAIASAREVIGREENELEVGRGGNTAEIAEAKQCLERFHAEKASAVKDATEADRRFRHILGLPHADGRRIIPVTQPVEARVELDWDRCRTALEQSQPDLARQRKAVEAARSRCLLALASELAADLLMLPEVQAKASEQSREAFDELRRQQDLLRKSDLGALQTLSRFFSMVDDTYRTLETARCTRAAAEARLHAEQDLYEEGRSTAKRYLDVISEYTAATIRESRSRGEYNVALAAVDESQGTLLAARDIAVLEKPSSIKPRAVEPSTVLHSPLADPAVVKTKTGDERAP